MLDHHPALAGSGELEIAQRAALHEAVEVARLGTFDSGDDQVRASVEAYLRGLRREWKPEAITIGEGDHIVVEINGARLEVHNVDGRPVVRGAADTSTIAIDIYKRLA